MSDDAIVNTKEDLLMMAPRAPKHDSKILELKARGDFLDKQKTSKVILSALCPPRRRHFSLLCFALSSPRTTYHYLLACCRRCCLFKALSA